MRKFIAIIIIFIILILSTIGLIFINYKSDIDAINSLNVNLMNVEKPLDIITDITVTSFKLNFDVEINNPSDRDVIDLSTDFKIYIEDNYVGEGNFSDVDVPNNSNISNNVIVTIYYDGLADAVVNIIKNIINNEEFKLEIKGTLYAKALFGMSIIEQDYIAKKTYQ